MNPARSRFDWILETVALAAMLGTAGLLASHWSDLPQLVPNRFGVAGLPDRWGPKKDLLTLPAIACLLYAAMTAISHNRNAINVPFPIDRNSPAVQATLLRMTIVLKMVIALIFLYIERANIDTAMGRADGLGKSFLVVSLAAVFCPLAFYLVRLRYR